MLQIGIVILLTIFILKGFFSFEIGRDDNSKSTDELRHEFQRKDILLLLLFFFLIPTFTVGLTIFFGYLSNWSLTNDDGIVHLIKPNTGTWILIGMLSALGCTIFAIFKIVKWVFKSKELDYWNYYNRKYGYRASRLLKYLGIFVIIISSILVCLNLNFYIKFKENKIEINQVDSFKSIEYGFEEIAKIIHYQKTIAPNGNIVDKPHYAIVFNDGFKWKTNDKLRTPQVNDDEIFRFLLEKTALKLDEKEIDQ